MASSTHSTAGKHVLALCGLISCCLGPGAQARTATAESRPAPPKAETKWRLPNLPIPVRADSPSWKDVVTTAGYRLQRHRHLGLFRLLDAANVRIGLGSRAYCDKLLAHELEHPDESQTRMNIDFFTLGGLQFWGDEMVYCGWRIQRNSRYGHFRLLDPRNIRRAWGTYEECETAFHRLADRSIVRPKSDEFVILLHGLLRARRSFSGMERHLADQGYEVVTIKYPSTQASIPELAAQLRRVIKRLEGARRIHFVTHSLGGLIVRYYLSEHRDPRIGRFVMIAPPNRGAVMAEMLVDWFPYRVITGPVGKQLTGGSASLIESLPVPWCEFAVIAGGRGDGRGYSPLIPGDDDGIVGVKETRLNGMRDFLVIPAIHILLPNHRRVREATVQFFQTGSFGDEPNAHL